MKRSEFFSEIRKGMFQTVKEVASPFIREDIVKLDHFVDQVAGIQWYDVGSSNSFRPLGTHNHFVGGRAIALVTSGQNWEAFDKTCPTCRMMVQWISYAKKFTCFQCEQSYAVEKQEGELVLARIPLKIEQGRLYLGLKKDS